MIRKLYYHSNKTIPGDDKEEKELDQDRKRHNSILKDIAYKRKKVQWTGATKLSHRVRAGGVVQL